MFPGEVASNVRGVRKAFRARNFPVHGFPGSYGGLRSYFCNYGMKPDLKTEAMKSIVRMTVAAAVLLFSAGSLAAQGPDGQKVTSDRRFGPGAEQRQEMDEQIKSVLTDAQYQKWTEMRSAMRTRHGHRRGYGPGQGKRSRPICDSVCPCAEAVSD